VRWTPDGSKVATNLYEAAAGHYAIKVTCKCGNSSTFNPHGLWWHFERRRWDDRLSQIGQRFWCRACGSNARRKVRPMDVHLVSESDADFQLPLPHPSVWKQLVKRRR